ncbi:MAG: hypothetical protein M1821_000797 [Bathelium mastoideum]|nr:MAG: hypothetical protein M1821_000797 [Bathelium mastoideum]
MLLFILAALGAIHLAAGHTLFTNFYLNGVDQGNGTCVRMPMTPSNATFPITNLLGDEIACGYNGENGVARVCPANAGSTITFEWRAIPDDGSAESIDVSHKGPCAVYLKNVDSAINDTAIGDGWFKIWDDGYDQTAGKWCTEKLRDNNGHMSVQLPSSIEGGSYLVRPELLALHQADKTPSNPQFYVGCAQLFINSTGTSKPSSTVAIPGYVQPGSPPVHFDIWTTPLALPYPLPGPVVANLTSSSSGKDSTQPLPLVQTEGLPPANCIISNANWCGTELTPYTTAAGCANATTACWAQARACYAAAPPTGDWGCRAWEAKCDGVQAQCQQARDAAVQGPPGYMHDLQPAAVTLSPVPAPSPTTVLAENVEGASEDQGKLAASASAVWASISGGGAGAPAQTSVAGSSTAGTAAPVSTGGGSTGGVKISLDGSCGGNLGQTCQGSVMGNCCSVHGYCGSSEDYCGEGCQAGFGSCDANAGAQMSKRVRRMLKRHEKRGQKHV